MITATAHPPLHDSLKLTGRIPMYWAISAVLEESLYEPLRVSLRGLLRDSLFWPLADVLRDTLDGRGTH